MEGVRSTSGLLGAMVYAARGGYPKLFLVKSNLLIFYDQNGDGEWGVDPNVRYRYKNNRLFFFHTLTD